MRSFPERAVRVRALAGDIVLCSWARHLTLTVPLSTQVYKWVPANCWGNLTNCGEVTCDGLASRPGGVEILLAASCYGNWDKLRQHEPVLAFKASLFFFLICFILKQYVLLYMTYLPILRLRISVIFLLIHLTSIHITLDFLMLVIYMLIIKTENST